MFFVSAQQRAGVGCSCPPQPLSPAGLSVHKLLFGRNQEARWGLAGSMQALCSTPTQACIHWTAGGTGRVHSLTRHLPQEGIRSPKSSLSCHHSWRTSRAIKQQELGRKPGLWMHGMPYVSWTACCLSPNTTDVSHGLRQQRPPTALRALRPGRHPECFTYWSFAAGFSSICSQHGLPFQEAVIEIFPSTLVLILCEH